MKTFGRQSRFWEEKRKTRVNNYRELGKTGTEKEKRNKIHTEAQDSTHTQWLSSYKDHQSIANSGVPVNVTRKNKGKKHIKKQNAHRTAPARNAAAKRGGFELLPAARIRRRRGRLWAATLPAEELMRPTSARSGNGAPIADPTHARTSRDFDLASIREVLFLVPLLAMNDNDGDFVVVNLTCLDLSQEQANQPFRRVGRSATRGSGKEEEGR
ncbi:translation initiation factor 6 [Striga asiatica]|uniref:Translation initiation factor 6 n=1 Tax=Striga asiatica TaxID=4170 RepID=A0A5A7PD96_STRAF|nr:translation initiation factor 6 [Striga asiatica]